jgi:hypothetical protein
LAKGAVVEEVFLVMAVVEEKRSVNVRVAQMKLPFERAKTTLNTKATPSRTQYRRR